MTPATLATDLINFLQLPVNSKIQVGNWTRIYKVVGNSTNYYVDFDNRGVIFRIRIWLTNGQNGAYIPPRWYITISNETPKSKLEIHNIDLQSKINHTNLNQNQSILHESFIGLGVNNKQAILSRFPCLNIIIATIDNRVSGWESNLILDLLNHGICREKIKLSIKKKPPIINGPVIKQQNIKANPLLLAGKSTQTSSKTVSGKTDFQEIVIKSLHAVLGLRPLITDKNLSQRFKNQMIEPLVRHFPEITPSGEITNGKVALFQKYFKWSERAVHEYTNYSPKDKKDKIYNYIKMEHIYPVNLIVDQLFKLSYTYSIHDIINTFSYSETVNNFGVTLNMGYEILIVSEQEFKLLNSGIGKDCDLIDVNTGIQIAYKSAGLGSKGTIAQRLAAANIKLHPQYISNTL